METCKTFIPLVLETLKKMKLKRNKKLNRELNLSPSKLQSLLQLRRSPRKKRLRRRSPEVLAFWDGEGPS